MFKAVAIADIHGSLAYFKKLTSYVQENAMNYIFVVGDIAADRDKVIFNRVIKTLSNTGAKILYVRGEADPEKLQNTIWDNIFNLEHTPFNVNENIVYGLPPSLDYELKIPIERKVKAYVRMLEEKVGSNKIKKCIILSHTPPYGVNVDKDRLRGNIGSIELKSFIERKKPLAVICGHVHTGLGIDNVETTVIINPGPFRRGYYAELMVSTEGRIVVRLHRFTLPF